MNMRQIENRLPIRGNLVTIQILSLLIAILMTVASVAGLFARASIYPTEELVQSFVPNDVVNLFIGLPILLGSMYLAWHGKLVGLLCWPGALFFVTYTYLAYVFAMTCAKAIEQNFDSSSSARLVKMQGTVVPATTAPVLAPARRFTAL